MGWKSSCLSLKDTIMKAICALEFRADAKLLFALSFSIATGKAFQIDREQALLVSSVQGIAGNISLIRHVTKICHDSSPAYLLLAAAQAIALALGIDMIVGLGKDEHVSSKRDGVPVAGFVFDYDGFWQSFAGNATHGAFYPVALPIPEKPLDAISPKHRSRAVQRREIRKQIANQVVSSMDQLSVPSVSGR